MTAQSKLRYGLNEPINHILSASHSHSEFEYSDMTVAISSNTTALPPSILHTNNVALPIGRLFGQDHVHYGLSSHDSPFDASEKYDHNAAPTDGDWVWFCSNCRDGPIGGWQPQCVNCNHVRCGSCTIENRK
jgi:hypothetical protein